MSETTMNVIAIALSVFIGIGFLVNLKPNIQFRRDISRYISQGYSFDLREGSFFYKKFFDNDEKNGFTFCSIGTHFYSINHTAKEIHIYR